jgi:4-alpha-glucanotransferase
MPWREARGAAKRADSPRPDFDLSRRRSGILLHVTALPGRHGCGDLGREAHRFLDFLAAAGQAWWQMLPVGPPGRAPAFSPYDSASAFAGSPWLVSLEVLAERGLLAERDLVPPVPLAAHRVDEAATARFRTAGLRRAFAAFRRRRGETSRAFREFCATHAEWLEDFALFSALREEAAGRPWSEWEAGVRQRRPSALRAARVRLADEIAGHRFVQFEFDCQWRALREHAHRLGVGLIGDLPIFVAHDSADVWSQPELFALDRHGRPRRVSGYPPDRFNPAGQHWGHPQFAWAEHRRTGFAWWVRRFARIFERFDAVRIDHFLGFTRTWSIPAHAASQSGRWVRSPGHELFAAVVRRLGARPMIAEDLGRVTADDLRLRESFGLAPMRVFQFGFGSEPDAAEHLPHSFPRRCAAYTGTHDSDTAVGWFRHLPAARRRRVLAYAGGSAAAPHLAAIRALMASPADTVVFPIQDVLGLGTRARFNVPGTVAGNWRWRLLRRDLDAPARWLHQLVLACDRAPAARHRARPPP